MSGSPNRPGLTAWGPFPKENPIPIKDPKRQIDAEMMSLLIWQVAGASLIMPKVWAVLDGTGGTLVLKAHAEAWNTDGSQPAPIPTYSAVGKYSLQYGSHFQDETGDSVESNLQWAVAINMSPTGLAFGAIPHRNAAASLTDFTVSVELKDSPANTFVDGPVLVLIW